MRIAGYIRVSRVNGRAGESFISPVVQQESLERWCGMHDAELAEVVIELDVSGGKAAAERELGRLIAACERGDLGGIIVWKLSRFGRSLADVVANVERLTTAGARFIAVEEGIDTGSRGSALLLAIFAGLAQVERESRKEGWLAARSSAVARGVVAREAPVGYRRTESKTFEPDPETWTAVMMVFQQRVEGASWAEIARCFERVTGRRMTHSAYPRLVRSRTYRGETVEGGAVYQTHQPMVSEDLWQLAQLDGKHHQHTGSISSHGIVSGLLRCDCCGGVMARTSNGKGYLTYVCRARKHGRECAAPSSASLPGLDAVVEPHILQALATVKTSQKRVELQAAESDAQTAHTELTAFVAHASAADLGELYSIEIGKRREALRAATKRLGDLRSEIETGMPTPDEWSALPIARKRQVAAKLIDTISLRKTGSRTETVESRLSLTMRSDLADVLPINRAA